MKRKLLSVILAVAMTTALAAGCGSQGAQTAASGGESGAEAGEQASSGGGQEAAAPADGENSLTVWCWDPAFNINAMQKAEAIYQKDHPDFKLNIVETPWEDIQTKLTTAATSG